MPWPDNRPPLVGFVMTRTRVRVTGIPPPSTCSRSVHSRAVSPLRIGSELPARTTFRPRGFSPPRRIPPPLEARACCIPLPIWGSPHFVWHRMPSSGRSLWMEHPPQSLAAQFVPPEGFPSPAAVPCHHGLCPPAVFEPRILRVVRSPVAGIPIDASSPWNVTTPGHCSADESVTSIRRFRRTNALSSHGLGSPPRSFQSTMHPKAPHFRQRDP